MTVPLLCVRGLCLNTPGGRPLLSFEAKLANSSLAAGTATQAPTSSHEPGPRSAPVEAGSTQLTSSRPML